MTVKTILMSGAIAIGLPLSVTAATVTIEDLTFDLDQFAGAFVVTDSNHQQGVLFDNAAGVDGFTVGELAAAPGGTFFPVDPGDQVTLGSDTTQRFLTLNYGPGVLIGSGQASLFAVYEQASSNAGTDEEGHYYEISVNSGSFVDARTFPVHQTAISANFQNRVVFDLLAPEFGFSVGDSLSTVMIRNILGSSSYSDPDFVFIGRAGTIAPVPLPASLPLLAGGIMLMGYVGRRRARRA